MNTIIKTAFRFNNIKSLLSTTKYVTTRTQHRQFARNLWYMCNSQSNNTLDFATKIHNSNTLCGCGCGKRGTHSKAEQELVEFLTEEIVAERKAQKSKTIPTEIDGFKAHLNGAEVTLTKKVGDESIKITFNVNHTVDTDVEGDINPEADKPDIAELKSKPSFKIDLLHDDTTVSLVCSFIGPDQREDGYDDIFGIDEISIYRGDWNENVYSVSGEVVDSYLYDLLLNYLDEKGITNEFVEKLSEYATAYEHSAYISLLEGLSKFASGK